MNSPPPQQCERGTDNCLQEKKCFSPPRAPRSGRQIIRKLNNFGLAYGWIGFIILIFAMGYAYIFLLPVVNAEINVHNQLVDAGMLSSQTSGAFQNHILIYTSLPLICLIVAAGYFIIKSLEKKGDVA